MINRRKIKKTNKQEIIARNSSEIMEKSFVKNASHVTLQNFETGFMQKPTRTFLCLPET